MIFTMYKAQQKATQGRGLQSKRHGLWRYVGKITVNQVKIVMEDASSWESVPRSSGTWNETANNERNLHIG